MGRGVGRSLLFAVLLACALPVRAADPWSAALTVADVGERLYCILFQNCVNAVADVLGAFGVRLPSPTRHPLPNHWYDRIPGPSRPVADLVDEVRRIIKRDALVVPSETSMTSSAVDGLLRSLDDTYAAYFDKKHFQYFNEQNKGSFVGVGIIPPFESACNCADVQAWRRRMFTQSYHPAVRVYAVPPGRVFRYESRRRS